MTEGLLRIARKNMEYFDGELDLKGSHDDFEWKLVQERTNWEIPSFSFLSERPLTCMRNRCRAVQRCALQWRAVLFTGVRSL